MHLLDDYDFYEKRSEFLLRHARGLGEVAEMPTTTDYCTAVHEHIQGFFAAWPPNASLKLGDFGYVRDNVFDRKSTLDSYNVQFRRRAGQGQAAYSLTNQAGATFILRGRGDIDPSGVPIAKARAEVSFSSEGTVFFYAVGCTVDEIEDQVGLGNELLSLLAQRQWNDDWYVVTKLVHAKSTTCAVAVSKDASLQLEAAGDDPHLDLANADIKLKASKHNSVENLLVSEGKLTPLIGLSRVRRRIFKGADFQFLDDYVHDTLQIREQLLNRGADFNEHFRFEEE